MRLTVQEAPPAGQFAFGSAEASSKTPIVPSPWSARYELQNGAALSDTQHRAKPHGYCVRDDCHPALNVPPYRNPPEAARALVLTTQMASAVLGFGALTAGHAASRITPAIVR
jgi:hypothetical protein